MSTAEWRTLAVAISAFVLCSSSVGFGAERDLERAVEKLVAERGGQLTRDPARPGKPVVRVHLPIGGKALTRWDLADIGRLTALEELSIGSAEVFDDDTGLLLKLQSLRSLDISDCFVEGRGFYRLTELRKLEELAAGVVTEEGLDCIAQIATLKSLRMRMANQIDFEKLSKCKSLRSLAVTGREGVTLGQVRQIGRLRQLEKLAIGVFVPIDDGHRIFFELAKLHKLRELNIVCYDPKTTTGVGFKEIASLAHLEFLRTNFDLAERDFAVLARCESLRELHLRSCTNGRARHVTSLRGLKALTVSGGDFNDEGCEFLKDAKLEQLTLSHTRVSDKSVPSLKGMQSLRRLDLRETRVTAQGVSAIQAALLNTEILHDHQKRVDR